MPDYIPEILKFLELNSYAVAHNSKQVQGVRTAVCGQYCAYFLIIRCSKIPLSRIVEPFSKTDFYANDVYVHGYIYKLFHIFLPLYQPK